MSRIDSREREHHKPKYREKIVHADAFSFTDLSLKIRSEPRRLGKKIFTKKTHIDALKAEAADIPAREKKKMAVDSRIPKSLNEMGRMTDFVNNMLEAQIAETLNETGSNARTKK